MRNIDETIKEWMELREAIRQEITARGGRTR